MFLGFSVCLQVQTPLYNVNQSQIFTVDYNKNPTSRKPVENRERGIETSNLDAKETICSPTDEQWMNQYPTKELNAKPNKQENQKNVKTNKISHAAKDKTTCITYRGATIEQINEHLTQQ